MSDMPEIVTVIDRPPASPPQPSRGSHQLCGLILSAAGIDIVENRIKVAHGGNMVTLGGPATFYLLIEETDRETRSVTHSISSEQALLVRNPETAGGHDIDVFISLA
jgi:hypothetical protein